MVCSTRPIFIGAADQLFRRSQLETVQAQLVDPALASIPLHGRIQRAVKQLIVGGTLSAGRRLPATRALAASLGVSRDTVENAYSQLQAEGFIERRSGSGSFVSSGARALGGPKLSPSARLRPQNGRQLLQLSYRGRAVAAGGGVQDHSVPRAFLPGVPETRTFPLAIWERLQRQVFREYGPRILNHGYSQGAEPLRKAIADYLNLERGAQASAERVLILTSSQQALGLCAHVLLDHGEGIFLEDPAYHGARKGFDASGLISIPIPVDREGMQVDLLRAQPRAGKAVYITPSHQYPTGVTLTLERRLALIEWARENKSWIIEDDYDSEFHYVRRPTACIQGLDPYERTIYIGTFSKSMFPSLRIGYVVLPSALVEPMTIARTLLDGHTAQISQITLARFIEAGHFGAHVKMMRRMYSARLDALVAAVNRNLAGIASPQIPVGGMQMPCLIVNSWREEETIRKAAHAGIELRGLSQLYHSKPGGTGWLLGFAALSPDEIEAGMQRLKLALTE